jgi:hypothetical protein
MIPIASMFAGIESMFKKDFETTKVEMIPHGRFQTRTQDSPRREVKFVNADSNPTQLERVRKRSHVETLLPRVLMALVIGLVSL